MKKTFDKADILIPNNIDIKKWSVVACDQYTSEPNYWEQVEEFVGDSPSSLNIIFPEAYLEKVDENEKIQSINKTMQKYLDNDLFNNYDNSLIYVERTLKNGEVRKGIIGKVDLLDYEFKKGSTPLIRATEGTVLERIPPRVRIRENAPLEIPHIMLLIDDQSKTIIENLGEHKENYKEVYNFELMQNSGSIKGYLLNEDIANDLLSKLDELSDKELFEKKYNVLEKGVLQYAVGDGNHSLAAAKTCYENLREKLSEQEFLNHNSRYALVELVNLHDDSLEFEAIHRILTEIDTKLFIETIKKYYDINTESGQQKFTLVENGNKTDYFISNPKSNLAVGSIQMFIDDYLLKNDGKVDYIHGEEVVAELSKSPYSIGILFDCMEKNELFKTVILDGCLPRKTFSMGHAWDKRFYLEARLEV